MGKWNYRRLSLIIVIALMVFGGAIMQTEGTKESLSFPNPLVTLDEQSTSLENSAISADETFLSDYGNPTGRTNFRDKEILIDENFTGNLPLVILDTGGQKPGRNSIYDSEKGYYVPLDTDPYAYGKIWIIDNSGRENRIMDSPVFQSEMKLRIRGNSSGNYDKQQYLLKLTDEKGNPKKQKVMDIGTDSEWILNVSFIDKSLLRNYLAYVTAGEIMPFTPDARFCEVIWKDGESLSYQGVYLMMESVKVGEDRVDLPRFSENSKNLPFLLRRDRYNLTGVILNNYGTEKELVPGFLDIEWPDKEVLTKNAIERITGQINRFEEALFAENYEDFIEYREYIDRQSFVDYFLLNEFFMNYDAGFNSTYIYSDYSGKLKMGPVWDFDQAMDNNETQEARLFTTAFHSAPWFEQILRDPEFVKALLERYEELRKGILSDKAIGEFLDGTIEGLGTAIERDWARWGYYYCNGNYLKPEYEGWPERNTKTYQEETDKLKKVLSVHGGWMDSHLDSLYQFSEKVEIYESKNKDIRESRGSMLAIVFVIVFGVSVVLVQRAEQADGQQ